MTARPRVSKVALVCAAAAFAAVAAGRADRVGAQGGAGEVQAGGPSQPAAAPAAAPQATVTRYCVSCHNDRLRTAGLVIDPAAAADPAADPATWEKVVRKLRAEAMPPAGAPRPDEATALALVTHLETAIDRAAAAAPLRGSLPLVHRLTRTEYGHAVRDLLALEHLPRELSIDLLLPPDNVSSGFDNIADLLFVSPSNMERYLDAARKISRLAVGDPAMPVMVNIHRLNPEHWQDERVEELPFGTRGGLAVRSDFPVDATYVIDVELAGAVRERHDLEVTVDGARVALRTLGEDGGGAGGGRGRGAAPEPLAFRVPLTAGPKTIGVAFVQRSDVRDESVLKPRMRSRGTLPAIGAVTIRGPFDVTGPGSSPSRQRLFVCHPGPGASPADERACATRILSTLARRAYRRPVTDTDLADLLPFYERGRAERDFDHGIQKALERVLVSAQFLFRLERPPTDAAPGATYRISDLELASRLSFLIWSSIPDDELLAEAEAGRLREPATLERQVRRMLADDRAEALVTNFAAQWLYLRDLDSKRPDEILFADFDETLRQAMRRETELFVSSVLREDRSVVELLTADYTFLNERLARHYGIPNVKGSYFRRVALPAGSPRGGLLGQGSVLTITSYATRTSPVVRGKWVLENLLSSAPPPPPPDVPSLSTEGEAPEKPLSLREAMTRHRAAPACAGCHARMDPIGFAMEEFDGIGRWRDHEAGVPLDTTGVFPDGRRFDGVAGLKAELLRQRAQFVGTIAERLLMYALGRNVQYYDAPAVRAILRQAEAGNTTFASLVLGVVRSRPFTERLLERE